MTAFSYLAVALSLGLTAVLSQDVDAPQYPPEQIHSALGNTPDMLSFTWQTWDYPIVTTANVRIGLSASALTRTVAGDTFLFTDPNSDHTQRVMHVVNVTGLQASTTYYYQVGDSAHGWSSVFQVKTIWDASTLAQIVTAGTPQKFVIFGDMGDTNNQALIAMTQEGREKREIDVIIHVGDIAYNMDSNQGKVGDIYMNQIQNLSTAVPYMVCLGNHEAAFNFSHYSQKFRGQPSNTGTVWTTSGPTPNNWYFSFNAGLVHYVVISTEIYFDFPHLVKTQYDWVMNDLNAANQNRTRAPWVVVYGHKPLYCSATPVSDCGTDAQLVREGVLNKTSGQRQYGMEELFYKYGADLYFCGHEHNYERMYDIYEGKSTHSTVNMPSTTYVVTGSAGSDEGKEGFQKTQPDWSVYRTEFYSYSRFYVYNATHVHLEQVVSDTTVKPDQDHTICDQTWFVQEHHGPFEESYGSVADDGAFVRDPRNGEVTEGVTVLKKRDSVHSMTDEERELEKMKEKRITYISDDKNDYRNVEGIQF